MPDYLPLPPDAYRSARRIGRKFIAEQNAKGRSGLLKTLESFRRDACAEIPMGLFDVPTKKINGTFSAGRRSAFAGNFHPILDEGTEFAAKWETLYASHLSEGIREPVRAYEYLGRYYIIEGNKRVSVLIYSGAYSVPAEVTRLLPPHDTRDPEVCVLYEILDGNRRAPVGDMWFSAPGRMTNLRGAARAAATRHPHWPENILDVSYSEFRKQYHRLGYGSLPITTGDAFHEYVAVFGIPYGTPEAMLAENIRNCLPQFERLGAETDSKTIGDTADISDLLVRRIDLIGRLLGRSQKLSVAFAFCGTPETHFFARAHKAGQLILKSEHPEVSIKSFEGLPEGHGAYTALAEHMGEDPPDLLFSTDPRLSPAALRIALECKDTTVLQCQYPMDDSFLPTYYGKTEEAFFLCGVLAGSLTHTGSVGTIKGRSVTGVCSSDIQAFAQGVRSVRPSARVYYANPVDRGIAGRRSAQESLARHGCDIIWLPFIPGQPAQRKAFPGLIGHLCAIDPAGNCVYYYASVAWHWDVFYTSLVRLITDPEVEMPPSRSGYHFRLGVQTGLLKVHPLYPAIQPWSKRLLSYFEELFAHGSIDPLDEDMPVEIFDD